MITGLYLPTSAEGNSRALNNERFVVKMPINIMHHFPGAASLREPVKMKKIILLLAWIVMAGSVRSLAQNAKPAEHLLRGLTGIRVDQSPALPGKSKAETGVLFKLRAIFGGLMYSSSLLIDQFSTQVAHIPDGGCSQQMKNQHAGYQKSSDGGIPFLLL